MCKLSSCRSVFCEQKIMTVVNLYLYEVVRFVHENKNKMFHSSAEIHEHNTRKCLDLKLDVNLPILREQLKIYNRLPLNYKVLKGKKFTNTLKTFFLNNTFYSLSEFDDFVFLI